VTALSIMRLVPSPPGKIEEGEALFMTPPDRWVALAAHESTLASAMSGVRAELRTKTAATSEEKKLLGLLDDVFASVDPGKEWEILQALRTARQGRTTLLMTHRLLAAEEADLVVVLGAGRVVEQGRHADLVAAGGAYARLWRIQQLEAELERD